VLTCSGRNCRVVSSILFFLLVSYRPLALRRELKLGWTASLGWAAALAVGVASLGRLNRLANARALAGSFAGKQE